MNQYEAMFLFDPTFGASWENCQAEIDRLMQRAEAEVLFCRRWDERRLAFRIKGRKRGVYVLTYFKAAAEMIGPLERDVQIGENLLRVLVLRADDLTPDMMERSYQQRESIEGNGDHRRRDDRDRDRDRGGRPPRDRVERSDAPAPAKEAPPKEASPKEAPPADAPAADAPAATATETPPAEGDSGK